MKENQVESCQKCLLVKTSLADLIKKSLTRFVKNRCVHAAKYKFILL